MPDLLCPVCGKRFPQQRGEHQVCPACGYRAKQTGHVQTPKGVVSSPPRAWVALLLGIATLGVWSSWLRFRAYDALDRQHGRDGSLGTYLMSLIPIIGIPFYIAHGMSAAKRLKDYRRARDLGAGPGAIWHLFLRIPIQVAFFGVLAIIYANDWDEFGWEAFTYSQFTDGLGTGFDNIFGDFSFPDQMPLFDIWSYLAVAYVGIILSTISAMILARSTRKLWKAIYAEQGVAWPHGDVE